VIRHPLSTHRIGAVKNNNNKLSFAIYRFRVVFFFYLFRPSHRLSYRNFVLPTYFFLCVLGFVCAAKNMGERMRKLVKTYKNINLLFFSRFC